MSSNWEQVPLSDLLKQQRREVAVEPTFDYDLLGVRWYAKGLFVKLRKAGSEIKATKLYRVEEGDFVYNRLFAWKGSFGSRGAWPSRMPRIERVSMLPYRQ